MSLVHEFVAVRQPQNKKILYSDEVYETINQGQIKKSAVLEIPDDVIQNILYDAHGKLLPDIKFNQWGISVYEKEELIYWIDFLKSISEEAENREYYHKLLDFMMTSYFNNNTVLHFGI
jgi:hypothetical protein